MLLANTLVFVYTPSFSSEFCGKIRKRASERERERGLRDLNLIEKFSLIFFSRRVVRGIKYEALSLIGEYGCGALMLSVGKFRKMLLLLTFQSDSCR
jgi:hypothetical protein